jgi:hypothetical protein
MFCCCVYFFESTGLSLPIFKPVQNTSRFAMGRAND